MWWFVFGLFIFELVRSLIEVIGHLYQVDPKLAVIAIAVLFFLGCTIPLAIQLFRLLKWSKNTKKSYSE